MIELSAQKGKGWEQEIRPIREPPFGQTTYRQGIQESKIGRIQYSLRPRYYHQPLTKYFYFLTVESTLTNLFDQHDIIPEEHYWWGEDCPFNIDEYFRITPHGITPPFLFLYVAPV